MEPEQTRDVRRINHGCRLTKNPGDCGAFRLAAGPGTGIDAV